MKHGFHNSPENRAWRAMKDRCLNDKHPSYPNYGGRGIGVCHRWQASFLAFHSDMGPRPSDKHSLDRIDNDKGYEPGNCRWATRSQQNGNQRVRQTKTAAVEEPVVWASAEFKQARQTLGYTAEQMARALGLGAHGARTIRRIEAGGNVTGPMSLAVQKLLADAQ